MTDAPAPSAEALVAFGWAPGDYLFTCRDCTDAQNTSRSLGYLEGADKRAYRCREHALEAALTAERERVKALEAEVEEQKNVGVLWMLDASGERHERQQAEARATAAEAQVKEMREERDKWRDDYFKARDALHPLTYPPDPQMLRTIADEIDCGRDCETGYTEYDTGAFVCRKEERGECGFAKAEELRAFAAAVEARSTLAATKEGA